MTLTTSSDPSKQLGNLLELKLSAEEITKRTEELIQSTKKLEDSIAQIPFEECTFKSVVLPLILNSSDYRVKESSLTFPAHVSTSKEIRDASVEADKKLSEFDIESSMREDIFKVLKNVKQREYETLGTDEKRLLDFMLRDYVRSGLDLAEDKRDKAKELKKQLSTLCITYQQNIAEDKTQLLFTKEELEGLTDDFLESLGKDAETSKYIVTLKYPELLPVMRNAVSSETRRKMEFASSTQCQDKNVSILEQVVDLRKELSALLGYKDHASFILDVRMAKTPERVFSFLNSLKDKTGDAALKDLDVLLEIKKAECEERKVPFDNKINAWDFNYYFRMLKETRYQVNEEEIKNYFPLDSVLEGLFSITQETFKLKFEEIKNPENAYHQDVRLFNVNDADTGNFIGQFYMDIFPREGKYTHAAAFGLQPGYERPDGTRQPGISAMVCNFTKPTSSKPSLLKHSEVETLFHEFGHLLHGVTTRVKYSRFSGTAVERDFVELPSQLMENWTFEVEALKRISRHFETNEPLPKDKIDNLIAAKNVLSALLTRRQLLFGLFDMTLHTSVEKLDTQALWEKLRNEITLVKHTPGTNPSASFAHIIGGYDAGYYGYLYSEVFSCDIFGVFKKNGIFNSDVGKKYRATILEKGGSVDGNDMLTAFLGREPSDQAFLESRGIVSSN